MFRVPNIWGRSISTPGPLRVRQGPVLTAGEPCFGNRKIFALRVSGSEDVIKKQTNPEIKMKEDCAIPQQIGQFGSGTVALSMPSGKVLLSLCGVSFISFILIFFLHRPRNTTVYVFFVMNWKTTEDFSSIFPLVQVAHSSVLLCEFFCGFLDHVNSPWPGHHSLSSSGFFGCWCYSYCSFLFYFFSHHTFFFSLCVHSELTLFISMNYRKLPVKRCMMISS